MRFVIACVLALFLAVPASAQTRSHTVLGYYKLLPQRFFALPIKDFSPLKLLRDGFDPQKTVAYNRSIVDLKNDFLRSPADGAQGCLTLAVFRYRGQETLAVFNDFEEGELSFWRLSKGRLREVTRTAFPFRLPASSSVVLPRQGTTIRVLRGNDHDVPKSGTVLMRFTWRGGKFHRAAR